MATTNLGMTLPTVGGDENSWGDELNAALEVVDAFAKRPTQQYFTTGTDATYTTPAGCRYIVITMRGGGGGGSSTGSSGVTAGSDGADTTFDNGGTPVVAKGGKGGATDARGGLGGVSSVDGKYRQAGAPGGNLAAVLWSDTPTYVNGGGYGGGAGGGRMPVGNSNSTGEAGVAGTGGGGSAGHIAAGNATAFAAAAGGAGGGQGEIVTWQINSPAATYTYSVGAGGAGGTVSAGAVGGAGGLGHILVREYY